MNKVAKDILMHYGVSVLDGAPGRGSGRYPRGSGENPNQHGTMDILERIADGEKRGLTRAQIAEELGTTSSKLKTQEQLAKNERRAAEVAKVKAMKAEGMMPTEIARKLGNNPATGKPYNESTIRSLLNESSEKNMNQARVTADYLKKIVDEKGMLDVSGGTEFQLNVSKEKLKEALYILELEGYPTYKGGIPQGAKRNGKQTNQMVLCVPGTPHKDIYDYEKVSSVMDYEGPTILTNNGNAERPRFAYPESLDSRRIQIRYAEQGGIEKDGVIELRRGVEDISLGNDHYAQVRILVDGTHYMKGMAIYSDNMPDGVDVVFNTNKKQGTPMKDVLKKITDDPDNPFGALIKENGGQRYYDDPKGRFTDPETGKKQSLSVINKRSAEGDWGEWSRNLPSQFLSKQKMGLIKSQLDLAKKEKVAEFDEICNYTNPTVKKKLLKAFSDSCDAAAVNLKAAALPRQQYQVIMPLTTISDKEVYAPNYNNGEKVALIRYPHGGTFEIPILTVNNKHPEGMRVLGPNAKDVVGINSKVAGRLSGADFDGDTVMVIPTNGKVNISSTPPLKGLEGFEPKIKYGPASSSVDSKGDKHYYNKDGKEYSIMKDTQKQMGIVSNLITDMTIKGASTEKLARAVRHSMVVIDAEKHKLDYKQSYIDNDIPSLIREFQRHPNGKIGGASTLISQAKGQQQVPKRQGSGYIDKETGALKWKTAENLYYEDKKKVPLKDEKGRIVRDEQGNKVFKTNPETGKPIWEPTGKTKMKIQVSTKMYETPDARTLSTGTQQEEAYADYANFMKALGNKARKEMVTTRGTTYNPSAREVYREEVDSLDAKLRNAERNRIKNRDARRMAASVVNAKRKAYEQAASSKKELDEELEKEYQRAYREARAKTGAKKYSIEITDREWEAIQSGAIHESKLEQILNDTDMDLIRKKATPKAQSALSSAKINMISSMAASGFTNKEIADRLGISTSTVSKYL